MLAAALTGSAACVSIAAASPSTPWLAWLALLPLLAMTRRQSLRQAWLGGVWWGLSFFAIASSPACGGLLKASVPAAALLIVLPGGFTLAGAWLNRRLGFSPLLMALGWMGLELALQPLGLRHGLLAATQGDGALMHMVGGLLGYTFVAFLIAYANAWLLTLAGAIRWSYGPTRLSAIRLSAGRRLPAMAENALVSAVLGSTRARPPPQLS